MIIEHRVEAIKGQLPADVEALVCRLRAHIEDLTERGRQAEAQDFVRELLTLEARRPTHYRIMPL